MSTVNVIQRCPFKRHGKYQIALHDVYFAISSNKDIFVNLFKNEYDEHIRLSGHHSDISAMCFEGNNSTYLASAGSHYIILWNIGEIEECFKNETRIRGKVVTQLEGIAPKLLSLSETASKLCTILQNEVIIYGCKDSKIMFCKDGRYSNASFFTEKLLILVKNNKIEIWDIEDDILSWTSSQFESSISQITVKAYTFTAACSNNKINCYIVNASSEVFLCQKKFEIDLDREMYHCKVTKSLEESNNNNNNNIISIFLARFRKTKDENNQCGYKVICATNEAIFIIDYFTQVVEILHLLKFGLSPLIEARFSQSKEGSVFCLANSMLGEEILMLQLNLMEKIETNQNSITILPASPIIDGSILQEVLIPNRVSQKPKKTEQKSLTFHTRISSSGYNKKTQNRKMFQPITRNSNHSNQKPKTGTRKLCINDTHSFSTDWSVPLEKPSYSSVGSHNINHISLSECNHYLTCSFPNSVAMIFDCKTNRHKSTLNGHNESVLGSNWSHASSRLLTYSKDRTTKMWAIEHPGKPILDVCLLNGSVCKKPDMIPNDVTHAQFYYVDRFMLLSFGNTFGVYSYYIDDSPKSDVKRYLEKNKYRLVKLFSAMDCQSITCIAAPNNIYSYAVLVCGSDKSVQVYDMNSASLAFCLKNAHTRPVHQLVLNTGSSFFQPDNYNLFTTTAPTDGIKLWDIRSMSCVAKYQSHPDACNGSFDMSPCGNFIASSGDDNCLHIYDTRKGNLLQSSLKQRDRISSVRFSKDGKALFAGFRNASLVTYTLA